MIPSWLVIGGVAFVLALLFSSFVSKPGAQWFRRLERPKWLTFEWAIPFIWTTIFTCGAISASLVWDEAPGTTTTWLLMGAYLLLEVVTLSYTSAMLLTRQLRVGFWIGAAGLAIAIILTILVFPISTAAGLLLVPYLLWSPIGTYVTWKMMQLNPSEA